MQNQTKLSVIEFIKIKLSVIELNKNNLLAQHPVDNNGNKTRFIAIALYRVVNDYEILMWMNKAYDAQVGISLGTYNNEHLSHSKHYEYHTPLFRLSKYPNDLYAQAMLLCNGDKPYVSLLNGEPPPPGLSSTRQLETYYRLVDQC